MLSDKEIRYAVIKGKAEKRYPHLRPYTPPYLSAHIEWLVRYYAEDKDYIETFFYLTPSGIYIKQRKVA